MQPGADKYAHPGWRYDEKTIAEIKEIYADKYGLKRDDPEFFRKLRAFFDLEERAILGVEDGKVKTD